MGTSQPNCFPKYVGSVDRPGVLDDDFDEFVRQLDLVVHERGGLWEPLTASAVVFPGRSETHGPWPQEACAQVLARWLDAGYLGIYRVESSDAAPTDLSTDDAEAVLADSTAWRPAMGMYLYPTSRGEDAPAEDWRAAAEPSA